MNDPALPEEVPSPRDSEHVPPSRGAIARHLQLWFGFREEVSRGVYAATGFGLTMFKYAVEAGALWAVNGARFTPLDFLNPVLSAREELIRGAPEWLGWAWFVWTLPFLWIAVSMSVRRAVNAGRSPWLGLLVLVPVVNLITMLILTGLPSQPHAPLKTTGDHAAAMDRFRSAVLGVAAGLAIALGMVGVSIYLFNVYGASIFLGAPVIMGAVAGVIYNAALPRSVSASISLGMLTVVLAGGALLVFALEGIICIAMAAPIAVPLGGLGGVIGKVIAETTIRPVQGMAAVVLVLPAWAGVESFAAPKREFVVLTVLDVDAPIDRVWRNVIKFPDLAPPEEWYFRLGIACPLKARIEGRGVGATRHCIFTTGTFVEPITAWDEPRLLAFDVAEQPPPMFELSPYRHVHPPHLHGTLRSTRGEFRLRTLPDKRTRLEGRTWYEFDMFPHAYWTLWSDLLIHRIHDRVLDHVRQLSESTPRRDGP